MIRSKFWISVRYCAVSTGYETQALPVQAIPVVRFVPDRTRHTVLCDGFLAAVNRGRPRDGPPKARNAAPALTVVDKTKLRREASPTGR
jgi:hypothetical protein